MRLGPLLHPVGPLPPAVYWRRRAGVLALVAALLTALGSTGLSRSDGPDRLTASGGGSAVVSPGPTGESPGAAPEGTPGAAPEGTPGATEGPASVAPSATTTSPPPPGGAVAEVPDCTAEDVRVELTVSPEQPAPGDVVELRVRVTGAGRGCRLDVGPVARSAEVTAGGEHVWSTEDCEAGDGSERVLLQPGGERELAVRWEGVRTAPGCPPGLPAPGPGDYTASAVVGPARSAQVPFRLG